MKKLWSLVILLFIVYYITNSINVVTFSYNMYGNKGVATISNRMSNNDKTYDQPNLRDCSFSALLNEEESLGG